MAAGIQPIKVICSIRHKIPVNILPRSINDSQGKRIASSVIVITCLVFQI
jgi:hypothetical protein